MLFEHARQVLKRNGLLVEAEFSDFMKGERGGEPFYDLDNDYSYQDARRSSLDYSELELSNG